MTTRPVALPSSYQPSRSSGASIPYRHDRLSAASQRGAHASQQQTQTQPSQQVSSEIHEYCCLFTHDLQQKKKRWKDGWVKHHVFNNRLMVYDLERNHVASCFLQADGETLEEGWEGRVDDVLVEVGELKRKEVQDLSKIFAKPQRSQTSQKPSSAVSGSALASTSQMSMAPPPARTSVKSGGSDSLKAVLARAKAKEDRKSWLKTPLVGFDLPADSEPSPAAERAKRRKIEPSSRKQKQDDIYAATPAPASRARGKDSNLEPAFRKKTPQPAPRKAPRSTKPLPGAQKTPAAESTKTPVNMQPQSSVITVSSDEDDSLFFPEAPRTYSVLPPGPDPAPTANLLLKTSTTRKKGLLCAPQPSRPALLSTGVNASRKEPEPPPSSPSPPKRRSLKFNPIPDPLVSDSDEEPAFETLKSSRHRTRADSAAKSTIVATPPEITDSQIMDLSFTPYVPSTGKPKRERVPQRGPWSAEAFFLFSKREIGSVPDCKERLDALEKARGK